MRAPGSTCPTCGSPRHGVEVAGGALILCRRMGCPEPLLFAPTPPIPSEHEGPKP